MCANIDVAGRGGCPFPFPLFALRFSSRHRAFPRVPLSFFVVTLRRPFSRVGPLSPPPPSLSPSPFSPRVPP